MRIKFIIFADPYPIFSLLTYSLFPIQAKINIVTACIMFSSRINLLSLKSGICITTSLLLSPEFPPRRFSTICAIFLIDRTVLCTKRTLYACSCYLCTIFYHSAIFIYINICLVKLTSYLSLTALVLATGLPLRKNQSEAHS